MAIACGEEIRRALATGLTPAEIGPATNLPEGQVRRLVLAGVSTHSCIAQTGADACAHDFQVSYAVDAIGSTDERYAEAMPEILSVGCRQSVLGRVEAELLFA